MPRVRSCRRGDAYAPWGLWNDPSLRGAPLALVAAAVLAANPHDTQPWLFRISDDAIEVLADLSRNLGAMDAFVREMNASALVMQAGHFTAGSLNVTAKRRGSMCRGPSHSTSPT